MLVCVISITSCTSDNVEEQINSDLDGLHLVSQVSNSYHSVELFSPSGNLFLGFNQVSLRIRDLATNQFITDTQVSWKPIMQMTNMSHGAPASSLEKDLDRAGLYSGHIVFTMPENEQEKWEVVVTFNLDGASYSVEIPVSVQATDTHNVTSFQGSDSKNYVLALVEPFEPEVALKDIQMVLYQTISMHQYVPAKEYTILLDPRMPGMGNHSSPNNQHLQHYKQEWYRGKLSLTMTGLWRLNLQLVSPQGTVIFGEPVTEDHPQSSLYFQFDL